MSIIIFAGHHPTKPGASYNGFNEHDEALRWLDLLRPYFSVEDLSIGPIGTLKTKTNYINNRNPLLACDLHFNSAPLVDNKRQGEGSMTLYYPGSVKGKLAADAVQNCICEVFKPDRGSREGYYRLDPTKSPDWFLARTKCTSLILEPEYIHQKEKIIDNREAGVEELAKGLAAAVNLIS